jgi:hypothetical protein
MQRRSRTATCSALAIAGALAALSLAACGPGGGNGTNAAGSSFDASFNASFDKNMHDSCVPSATLHGASPEAAEKYCACVVTELDKLSSQDKMALPLHQEKMQAAASVCNAQISAQ